MILDELLGCCQKYPHEVEQILLLSLKEIRQGFAYQKEAIFSLGKNAKNDTGSVDNISLLSATELEEMDQNKVQVHNIGEKWNARLFNYKTGDCCRKKCQSSF